MADRISRLVDSPELRESMGRRGYERVLTNFDLRVIARRWEQLYQEILQT
jgi:glycosyltransferase involved in cell wall biosynthesis